MMGITNRRGYIMMIDRTDIPIGRSCAVQRSELAKRWHCTEREVRGQIARFRKVPSGDGFAILSSSSAPAGYWRSNDPHEINAFIGEMQRRARHTILALEEARTVLGGGAHDRAI